MVLDDYKELKKLEKSDLIDIIFDLRIINEELEKISLRKKIKKKSNDREERKQLLQRARDLKKEKLQKQLLKNHEKIKELIKENAKNNKKTKVTEIIKKLEISKQTYYNQKLDEFVEKIYRENTIKNEFRFGSIWVKKLYKGNQKKEIVIFDMFSQLVEKYKVKNNFEYRKVMQMIGEKYPYVIFEVTEKNNWEG